MGGLVKLTAYLVIGRSPRGLVRARRVTTRRPYLEAEEALIRLELELPDDVFEAPLITVPVERTDVAVAVALGPPLEEEGEE
jgi:hypothetical protein